MKGRLGWQGLKADEYRDEGPYVVSSAHFENYRIQWNECPRVSEDRYSTDANIQLAEGDVLLMKDGAAMGKLAFVDALPGPACLNSHLLLFRPIKSSIGRHFFPRFLFYFFQTDYFQEYIKVNGTGATFLGISQYAVGKFEIVAPAIEEQESIAAFLDRETATIDALVAEQLRLMELLKEKRQAVISHAVTKGLNPRAPKRDSGIKWIGEVPAHWGLKPIKHLVTCKSGGTPSKGNLEYWDGDVPWASSKDLKSEQLNDTEDHITVKAIDDGASELVPAGSILIVVRGMILIHTFPVVKALVPVAINQDLKALTPYPGLDIDYLAWLLRGSSLETLGRVDEAAHGTTVLRMDVWTSMILPLPPIAEQRTIVEEIEKSVKQLDALGRDAQQAIDLLQERRSALISAAVTGQIDVRQLHATLESV
jgi:type I restriction enzyme, S subunit